MGQSLESPTLNLKVLGIFSEESYHCSGYHGLSQGTFSDCWREGERERERGGGLLKKKLSGRENVSYNSKFQAEKISWLMGQIFTENSSISELTGASNGGKSLESLPQ